MGAYAPAIGKNISRILKNPNKNLTHRSKHFMYVRHVLPKNDIFVCYVKKILKKVSCKSLF
jgi:hypothetical protein